MKMKKQFSSKTISITFCIFVLLFVLGFYVVAWEEPASAPPDGNVYAPINTGNSNQYKEGRLGVYTNEIDEGFGLTIGRMGREGGIKATGYSWFDGDIDTSGDIDAGGQICDSTGCIGGLGGSLWTQSGTNIYYDSDNVGIGTVAPGAKLEINKSGLGLYLNQPAAADIYMRYHVPGVRWWTVGSKANGDFWFSNASDLSASGPLTLTSGGNVGIGTASPGYKLTVNGPIGTPNMNHPYLVLDSSGSGSNTNEQSAQISLGESGRGSASLHLAYTGDGYSYIGMGDLGPDNIPDHWAMKLYYGNDDIYAHNNIDANDVYIRAIGKWASTLAGGDNLGNHIATQGIKRNAHATGYLEGSYNNVGANSAKSNPIYVMGSSYKPTDTSLGNMYGIGYSHNNFWTGGSGTTGWGMYVAADGDIRHILDASTGVAWASGSMRAPIFYDSNNTSYYVNPASTSYLNDVRANIFYDRNDTTYRVDPNGTSRLNDLYMYDDLFIGSSAGDDSADMYIADKLYDWDNTGYYLDPNSTSRLYRIDANYFYYASDITLKANIRPIVGGLDKILELEGVSFNWKDNGKASIGLISQDVEKIFPEIVSTNEEGLKSIEYAKLVAPLIEAIKEQQKEIDELRNEIEQLR